MTGGHHSVAEFVLKPPKHSSRGQRILECGTWMFSLGQKGCWKRVGIWVCSMFLVYPWKATTIQWLNVFFFKYVSTKWVLLNKLCITSSPSFWSFVTSRIDPFVSRPATLKKWPSAPEIVWESPYVSRAQREPWDFSGLSDLVSEGFSWCGPQLAHWPIICGVLISLLLLLYVIVIIVITIVLLLLLYYCYNIYIYVYIYNILFIFICIFIYIYIYIYLCIYIYTYLYIYIIYIYMYIYIHKWRFLQNRNISKITQVMDHFSIETTMVTTGDPPWFVAQPPSRSPIGRRLPYPEWYRKSMGFNQQWIYIGFTY